MENNRNKISPKIVEEKWIFKNSNFLKNTIKPYIF